MHFDDLLRYTSVELVAHPSSHLLGWNLDSR